MGLAMAAAHDAGVEFMVLDRPNPLGGNLVSGFDRTLDQESFISQYPISAVYAMTPGELAGMIAGEGWVSDQPFDNPTVVTMSGWSRDPWPSDKTWIPPSPGLPTIAATRTYPGTVLFEATTLSYGKGTEAPLALDGVTFTAITTTPSPAVAANPRYSGELLGAVEINVTGPESYRPVAAGVHLLAALRDQTGGTEFIDRPATFDLLAGTTQLRSMLQSGAAATEIIAAWEAESAAFALRREPYLLY